MLTLPKRYSVRREDHSGGIAKNKVVDKPFYVSLALIVHHGRAELAYPLPLSEHIILDPTQSLIVLQKEWLRLAKLIAVIPVGFLSFVP